MVKMAFEFLDVGMGDGTLVIMGNTDLTREIALVDFGVHHCTQFKVGAEDALAFLVTYINKLSKARGLVVPFLDQLFLTHPHEDHYNRIRDLLTAEYPGYKGKPLSIGRLNYGGDADLYEGDLIEDIMKQVIDEDDSGPLPAKAMSTEPYWQFVKKQINVYCLSVNSPKYKTKKDKNQLSLCLMFDDGDGNKVILMGDAGNQIEKEIIARFSGSPGFLNAYGLKLGHHGSEGSSSKPWLDAVKPKAVFASGDFVWAHPYCSAIERVKKNAPLESSEAHWYCCGVPIDQKTSVYHNNETDRQIYLNLWYVVNKAKEEMQVSKTVTMMMDKGTTYGVQWELFFNGGAAPAIFSSELVYPVKKK